MLKFLKDLLFESNGYSEHPEAVIIACYYNPEKSPYRLKAFNIWYDSIKHLNHRVIECVIGDGKSELPENENISKIHTTTLLWHKEALLNKLVSGLPKKFQYIFWVDTDIIFTNKKWLSEGVEALKTYKLIQPFEYGIHLEKDENKPSFKADEYRHYSDSPTLRNKSMWRSFASNYGRGLSGDLNYDVHGHVGFAWGARRSVLEKVALYDKALIGGGDHIIAHAAAGQIPHNCITKTFGDQIQEIIDWSENFYIAVSGSIGYIKGDVYHIWHGDRENREYLKRVQEFAPIAKDIVEKDHNGLYKTNDPVATNYVKDHYKKRENVTITRKPPKHHDPRKRYNYNGMVYRYTNNGDLIDDLGNLIYDIALLNMIMDDSNSYYDNTSYDP